MTGIDTTERIPLPLHLPFKYMQYLLERKNPELFIFLFYKKF